jgi:hypothetical protein
VVHVVGDAEAGVSRQCLSSGWHTAETERAQAVEVWNIHYNDHRPHTAAENQPPASRLDLGVTNVMRSYS